MGKTEINLCDKSEAQSGDDRFKFRTLANTFYLKRLFQLFCSFLPHISVLLWQLFHQVSQLPVLSLCLLYSFNSPTLLASFLSPSPALPSHVTEIKSSLARLVEGSGGLFFVFFSTLKFDKWRSVGQSNHPRLPPGLCSWIPHRPAEGERDAGLGGGWRGCLIHTLPLWLGKSCLMWYFVLRQIVCPESKTDLKKLKLQHDLRQIKVWTHLCVCSWGYRG